MSRPLSSPSQLGKPSTEAKVRANSCLDSGPRVLLLHQTKNVPRNEDGRGRKQDYSPINFDDSHPELSNAERVGIESSSQVAVRELNRNMQSSSVSPTATGMDKAEQEFSHEVDPISSHGERLGKEIFLDSAPQAPRQEASPPRGSTRGTEVQADDGPAPELQSIMDQFDDTDNTEDDASHIEVTPQTPHLKSPIEHPPRRSSLEPLASSVSEAGPQSTDRIRLSNYAVNASFSSSEAPEPELVAKIPPTRTSSLPQSAPPQNNDANVPSSPNSSRSISKMPPPAPDPEPDLPFDFHRFLEQLRHRTADPVAKFLRSFLIEFGKKQWMVHEQVKIINDFLTFITIKMAQCEVWRGASDAEFDNAKEGMEKLVMNRLYSQTFSPAIPAPAPMQETKGKKKNTEKSLGPGRRGQHQEDIERDEILSQKVRIYGWIREEHLDIWPVGDSGRRFLVLAQQGKIPAKASVIPGH